MKDSYISYFTPSEMTPETLEFIFVKREKLAARLVDRVRDSVLTSAKHQSLLVGPRGMGKSHMVALVYHRVKKLTELEGKIAMAWLAEEEWSVGSLVDFYFVVLEALEREYGGLQSQIDELYELPMEQRTAAAGEQIREFVGEGTLFLLVENLEEIFNGLNSDELWSLRSFLSKTPFATVLATTPNLFSSLTRQKEAFFQFFQPTYLDELTVEEATALLGKLAERRGDTLLTNFLKTSTAQDRVQAVHDLAGGHPRLYLLFAHLLTQSSDLDELVTPFMEFLDELTPYFQDRMKGLSPQQRKIITFLCDRRGAVSIKEIVARTNSMTSQTISGQLDKLDEMGYVRNTRVGRSSYYELREPLLRMIVEKKRGRGEPIRLVVDFLRRWYNRDERHERLKRFGGKYWEASLDLERAIQDTPDPKRAEKLSPEFWEAYNTDDFSRAVELAAEIIERKGRACKANDWFWYGRCLSEIGEYLKAIESFNKNIELNPKDAYAWNGLGHALNDLGRYEEALQSLNKAIELNPQKTFIWSNRGYALDGLRRHNEALQSYDEAIELDPRNANAWSNRGYALNDLDRYEEALQNVDKAIRLAPKHFSAWHGRGYILYNLCRYDEALQSIDKAIELVPKFARQWFHRAKILLRRDQWDEFLRSVDMGLSLGPAKDIRMHDAEVYCRILLRTSPPTPLSQSARSSLVEGEKSADTSSALPSLLRRGAGGEVWSVSALTTLYAKYNAVGTLGQGLVESIPALVAPDITQTRAEAWLAAWNAAGANEPDLTVPLRLLNAAVAWKPNHDIRALLALAIEERRILERLLEPSPPSPSPLRSGEG